MSGVQFAPDTIELSFMVTPDDLRSIAGEPVAMMRTVVVGRSSPAYSDEIADLVRAAEALVEDVLDDWPGAPVGIPDEDDEDDDSGMGQG